jgi:nucleoside-diphosphate-sugar epimerase
MILLTGFPGFLASALLPRLLDRTAGEALCLVQPKFRPLAAERAAALGGRVRLLDADLTRPLGHVDVREVTEIFHFAAVYDLGVRRETGLAVNVTGTQRMLDLAERAPKLARFHYVSTCYVSGRHPGVFLEADLEKGQQFNNFYEETKQLAEVEVRRRMHAVPATVYRPSVVVGDSTTGATQKFDGPYCVIQWLLRQPRVAILPVVGDPTRHKFNVVPSDFIVDAMAYLSGLAGGAGKTYALADPEPLTVDRTIEVIAEAAERKVIRLPLTRGIAKGALAYLPGLERLLRIPPAAVDYFVHPTSYDTTNASEALRAAGIRVPRFVDYAPRLVEFVRRHPEIGAAAMA